MGFWAELVKTGRWTDMHGQVVDIAEKDIDTIVSNFDATHPDIQPTLRLGGHDKLLPNVGIVTKLKREGAKMLGYLEDVPEIVMEAIEKGRYRKVSIGLSSTEHKGKKYDWLMNHVAVLGAKLPAVSGLSDLRTYLSEDEIPATVICFTQQDDPKPKSNPKNPKPETTHLATVLSAAIDAKTTSDDTKLENVVALMSKESSMSATDVLSLIGGDNETVSLERLQGFSRALDVSWGELITAAEKDGCEFHGGMDMEDKALQAQLEAEKKKTEKLTAENKKLNTEVTSTREKSFEQEVTGIVEKAIQEGKAVPAQKDSLIKVGLSLRKAGVNLSEGEADPFEDWKKTFADGVKVVDMSEKAQKGREEDDRDQFTKDLEAGEKEIRDLQKAESDQD